jgi:hypothetical protein
MHRIRCIVPLMVALLALPPAAGAKSVHDLMMSPSEFNILNADTGVLVGHGKYSAIEDAHGFELRGDNRYLDGAYDIEQDRLQIVDGKPLLRQFKHSFFLKGGAPESEARVDVDSSLGSCVYYHGANATRDDAKLDFSRDTFAGMTVLLPIQEFLRTRRDGAKLRLHVFNCAPGPKLLTVEVIPEAAPTRWVHYPGRALDQIDIKPDFGWLNFVILPFVPKLAAWFDPTNNWELIGARLQRYYRGPNIILVRSDLAAPRSRHAGRTENPSVAGSPPP